MTLKITTESGFLYSFTNLLTTLPSAENNFIIYNPFDKSLIFISAKVRCIAWWSHESDLILLKHYGYNIDGMSETEFFGNVLPENMGKVKRLETRVMGIGWPVKAIFGFVMTIPYLIFVYIGKVLIEKVMLKKNEA